MRLPRRAVGAVVILTASVLVGPVAGEPASLVDSAHAQPVEPAPGAFRRGLALWSAEYTLSPGLPDYEGAYSLASDGDNLWLASEPFVTRFTHGVWGQPEYPPHGASVFAVTAHSGVAWAFGFEGGAWRRTASAWQRMPVDSLADFYSAVATGPDEVWAAGFDFDAEYGTVLYAAGHTVELFSPTWFYRRQLFAIAAAPDGTLWAGGCDYDLVGYLIRRPPAGTWEPYPMDDPTGCITHLSFADAGHGLAAGGTDVLVWDGQAWTRAELAPPAGKQWVRVAASDPGPEPTESAAGSDALPAAARLADTRALPVAGWALPAVRRWPGYVDAEAPVYFNGSAWREGVLEDPGLDLALLGPGDGDGAYLALHSDGRQAWAVSRLTPSVALGNEIAAAAAETAGLLALDRGRIKLAHPHVVVPRSIAANATGAWIGGLGPRAVLQKAALRWEPSGPADAFSAQRLDFAATGFGWATGSAWAGSPAEPVTTTTAWRWDGAAWVDARLPDGLPPVDGIRTLPDGGAWASAGPRLLEFHLGEWRPLAGAPRLPADRPSGWGTLFDLVAGPEGLVSWIAAVDGLYRGSRGTFVRVDQPAAYRVADLVLTSDRTGWARARVGDGVGATPGHQLLRLTGTEWRVVPPAAVGGRVVDWHAMAAAGPTEVWLLGEVRVAAAETRRILVRYNGVWSAFGASDGDSVPSCDAQGLAAVIRRSSGSEVWLIGSEGRCGPVAHGETATGSAIISRLVVRPVVSRLALPWTSRP